MPGSLRVVPVERATESLRELVTLLRGDDPLSPLTVIVPSALAGATLRRGLFPNGLAGVRFTSLPQYVEGVLTAAGQASGRRTGPRRRALVAKALDGSAWAADTYTTGTLQLFDALMAELDEASLEAPLDNTKVQALDTAYRALLPEAERELPADRAAGHVTAGTVVLHLPRRLMPAELRFCQSLGHDLHVVLGTTGDARADEEVLKLAHDLGLDSQAPEAPDRIVVGAAEPDAEEEARQAVRRVLTHLADDPTAKAERTAIAYRATVPYARLLHEQLTAAGLPHHVPRQRTLAQSLAGNALLGLLALTDSDYARAEVAAWWACAPLRRPDKTRLNATRWNRRSIEAGVTRGKKTWLTRLDTALDRAQGLLSSVDEKQAERAQQAVDDLVLLREDMTSLFDQHDALTAADSWNAAAAVCHSMVTQHLGSAKVVAYWGPHDLPATGTTAEVEQSAYDELLRALTSLGDLDADLLYTGVEGFRQVLEAELSRPLRESQGLGRGVLVAPIADFVGADVDLLIVVGMVEGSFPPRAREHPLLRDAVRAKTNGALRTTAERRIAERRDFLTSLGGAREVVLTYPLADLRSKRATHPAPWFLELVTNETPQTSFTRVLLEAKTVLNPSEYDSRILMDPTFAVSTQHPLVAAEPALALGIEAVTARSTGSFGRWTGHVPNMAEGHGRSASALQTYAACPLSFFLGRVLYITELEEPAEEATGLDVGNVVHDTLEAFFSTRFDQDPDIAWSPEDHAEARQLLETHAAALAGRGRAGRPLVWANKLANMRRSLRRTLIADDLRRSTNRSRPMAVELGFGTDGAPFPAVDIEIEPGRSIALRGSIDRVDQHEDGNVTVLDWKSGGGKTYKDMDLEDLTNRGQNLQLPLYAEAARRALPDARDVDGYYVLVDVGAKEIGGRIDPGQDERLRHVLDVVTTGIDKGLFPARPGDEDYFSRFKNCGFCAFERLCPSSRDAQWLELRTSPELTDYVELAEGDLA